MYATAKKKLRYGLALVALLLGLALAVYYTGDQDGKVATSAFFSIDTSDPDAVTAGATLLL